MREVTVSTLFEQFRRAFEHGEQPDAAAFVERAGDRGDELAELIGGYLLDTAPPEPSEAAVAQLAAWLQGEAPLVALRRSRGVERDAVVDALVVGLGIDRGERGRVADYVHELEAGLLDPRRVSRRVLAVLAETLAARPQDLLAWRARPTGPAPAAAFTRAPELADVDRAQLAELAAPPAAAPPEWDEVDRLFLAGPDA
jgi:hypothetical protein